MAKVSGLPEPPNTEGAPDEAILMEPSCAVQTNGAAAAPFFSAAISAEVPSGAFPIALGQHRVTAGFLPCRKPRLASPYAGKTA